MIKAIFFDIDGTLISLKTQQIPESAKKALQSLHQKGILLFLASGRPPKNIRYVQDMMDFECDGFITMNGQYCYQRGGLVYENWIPQEDLRLLTPFLEKEQIACTFMELDYSYNNFINDRIRNLYQTIGQTQKIDPVDDVRRIETHKVYQLNIFVQESEEFWLKNYLPACKFLRWYPNYVDVISADGGKPVGIDKMLEAYHIRLDETAAFGDGGNDIDMLKHVGTGIAMGNADKKVKAIADFVTLDVDQDGILYALRKLDLLS
jgi:Cof subfamily protein (haloacid dehalogenase superfamily)